MMLQRLFRLLCLQCLLLAWPAWAIPALWQVSNDKGGSLTLLGTVHVLPTRVLIGEAPPDPDWFSPKARAAFDAAGTLIVEIVPDPDAAMRQRQFEKLALLARPVPVVRRLPADLRPQYEAMLAMAGLAPAQLDRLRNWAVALVLVQSQVTMLGLDLGSGADQTLMDKARASDKRLLPLETAGQQLALFSMLSPAEQREMLIATVRDAKQSRDLMTRMIAAWQAGDVDRLGEAFAQSDLSVEAQRRLLRDRNANWAAQISRMFTGQQRLFMAVGAGHMTGPDSLIPMLEARGFTVKRLE